MDILEAIENHEPGTNAAERVIECLKGECHERDLEESLGLTLDRDEQVVSKHMFILQFEDGRT